jgi:hypothetical protein
MSVSKLRESLKTVSGLRLLDNRDASVFPGYYKLGFQYDPGEFNGLSRDSFAQAVLAEGIDVKDGFRALHLCRSSRRFRKAGELAIATMADANMLALHHPALLAGDEAIDQIARAVHRIRAWADFIKNAPDQRSER